MQARLYRAEDAPHLGEIYVRAIRGLAPRGYDAVQVEAWAGRVTTTEETHARCSDGRLVLVATDENDTPIAFMDLEDDGHIDMMFCRPEWSGRGVASALFGRISAVAADRGMPRLYTEASEIAKPVFGKWGFHLVRRNDMEIEGVAIHNYAMEKHLGGGGVGD
ncbi:MAG: GNAT family N-acetyltransferase [Alphaproteobacteria bacterium]|nr:GNAT family N-acetyltransferase [Alphaproteobacteria bacterium]